MSGHPRGEAERGILALLNGLSLGEISRVMNELSRAEAGLVELGHSALAQRVEEARARLAAGDVREFRRAVATVAARLGHLK